MRLKIGLFKNSKLKGPSWMIFRQKTLWAPKTASYRYIYIVRSRGVDAKARRLPKNLNLNFLGIKLVEPGLSRDPEFSSSNY